MKGRGLLLACYRIRSLLSARQVLSLDVNDDPQSSVNGGLGSIETILKTIPDLLNDYIL